MKRIVTFVALFMFCMAITVSTAQAQAPAPAAPAAAPAKVNDDVWAVFEDSQTKLAKLAQAFPQEKYSWRPQEGVRSVSEVFLHEAQANYGVARALGMAPPPEVKLGPDFDKSTTDKAKIIELMAASFEHLKKAVAAADPDKMVGPPDRQRSTRRVMIAYAAHSHEHLGQSIAYARVNNITPPWTEEAQQRQQQQPKKSN